MPLISSKLEKSLSKYFNQEDENFIALPKDNIEAAQRWTESFHEYASQVTPFSATSSLAKEAFYNSFLLINNANGFVQFGNCFVQYCAILGSGMQPGFSAIPPPGPPPFEALMPFGLAGASNEDCLKLLVSIVDAWMKTGIAVNNSSSASIKWA